MGHVKNAVERRVPVAVQASRRRHAAKPQPVVPSPVPQARCAGERRGRRGGVQLVRDSDAHFVGLRNVDVAGAEHSRVRVVRHIDLAAPGPTAHAPLELRTLHGVIAVYGARRELRQELRVRAASVVDGAVAITPIRADARYDRVRVVVDGLRGGRLRGPPTGILDGHSPSVRPGGRQHGRSRRRGRASRAHPGAAERDGCQRRPAVQRVRDAQVRLAVSLRERRPFSDRTVRGVVRCCERHTARLDTRRDAQRVGRGRRADGRAPALRHAGDGARATCGARERGGH